jgi:hypothetical protein
MERLLPGLTEELVRAGAAPLDFTREVRWISPWGWYVRFPGDRGRVAGLPNVRIQQEAHVAGLIRGQDDGAGVACVRLRSRADDDGNRKTTPLREKTDGRSRSLRRTVVDPDVMIAEGSRGRSEQATPHREQSPLSKRAARCWLRR